MSIKWRISDDPGTRGSGRWLLLGNAGSVSPASGGDLNSRWLHRRRRRQRDLPQSRYPCGGYRDHLRSAEDQLPQSLEFFFQIHDPTTRNRQGNDVGASYRSAIFYTSDEQKRVAEDTIADVDASGLWPGKVVTELVPVGPFWQAEPEHQDYLERVPNGYTCHFVRPNWKLPKRTQTKSTDRARA